MIGMSNPVMVALAPDETGPGVAMACRGCGHQERFARGKAGSVELMQALDRHLTCRRPSLAPRRPSLTRTRVLAAKQARHG